MTRYGITIHHNHIPGDVVAQLLTPEPNHRLLLLAPALRLHNCTETGFWYIHLGKRCLRDHTTCGQVIHHKNSSSQFIVFFVKHEMVARHMWFPLQTKLAQLLLPVHDWISVIYPISAVGIFCVSCRIFLHGSESGRIDRPTRTWPSQCVSMTTRKRWKSRYFESTMASRNLTTKVLILDTFQQHDFQVKLWNLVDFTKRYDESLVATLPKPCIFPKAAQILCLRIVFVLLFSSSQAFQEPAKSIKNISCKVQQSRILIGGTTTTSCCLWCSIAGSERVPISDLGATVLKIIPKKDGVG